jgi:DNA-binding transcriptional regulator YiaG
MGDFRSEVVISQKEVVSREEFAFYIKSMRKSIRLSRSDFGKIIEVNAHTVKQYEDGKQIPQDPYTVVTAIRQYIKSRRK